MTRCICAWALTVALAGAVDLATAAAPRYELIDLAALSQSPQSSAQAINNADEVVGYATRTDGTEQPVRFVNGRAKRVVLHTDLAYRGGVAAAISDAGHVAGNLTLGHRAWPVFVTLGDVTTLYAPPERGAEVTGINSRGQVTGWRVPDALPHRAFVMQDGQWMDLPVPQADLPSYAWAINDAGQVAGQVQRMVEGVRRQEGALWQDGELKETFGLPGSLSTLALAINRRGWVVGSSQVGPRYSQTHAYLHRDGVTIDLETRHGARSYAYGINTAGEVIGDRVLAARWGPFLYSSGRMWWLAQLLPAAQQAQWRLVLVHAINDAGHVVGVAANAQGRLHAVMLRRLPAQVAAP